MASRDCLKYLGNLSILETYQHYADQKIIYTSQYTDASKPSKGSKCNRKLYLPKHGTFGIIDEVLFCEIAKIAKTPDSQPKLLNLVRRIKYICIYLYSYVYIFIHTFIYLYIYNHEHYKSVLVK